MTVPSLPIAELLARSDALHQRVQRFSRELSLRPAQFEDLALELARFQAAAIPGYGRLVRACGSTLKHFSEIPAVPVEAFRLTRVATHADELDTVTFLTSGTTSGTRGGHHLRRTDTYRAVALAWGKAALLPLDEPRPRVLCLAPPPSTPQQSSLGFMMQAFAEQFEGPEAAVRPKSWLLSEGGVDIDGLCEGIAEAQAEGRPVLILATSFALVFLLDALGGRLLPTDPRTVVMQTGGFKGKTRYVEAATLTKSVAQTFGISETQVISEYGMTELGSQLYEGTLPASAFRTEPGWYLPPPWLRVEAVDGGNQLPVPDGTEGLACFTDLANVDSAVRILTMDQIVCRGRTVKLLGRQLGAMPRGCSLAIEELVT